MKSKGMNPDDGHREELFATFSRDGQPLGLRRRSEVHRLGLWHKSAQVFVFDDAGRLLLQQRVPHKDLYADLWDYSVGEHLQPEETFIAGAQRGLQEELSIVPREELQPLGGLRWVEHVSSTHADREIQQAFRCRYDGDVVLDPLEVAQVRYIDMAELAL